MSRFEGVFSIPPSPSSSLLDGGGICHSFLRLRSASPALPALPHALSRPCPIQVPQDAAQGWCQLCGKGSYSNPRCRCHLPPLPCPSPGVRARSVPSPALQEDPAVPQRCRRGTGQQGTLCGSGRAGEGLKPPFSSGRGGEIHRLSQKERGDGEGAPCRSPLGCVGHGGVALT